MVGLFFGGGGTWSPRSSLHSGAYGRSPYRQRLIFQPQPLSIIKSLEDQHPFLDHVHNAGTLARAPLANICRMFGEHGNRRFKKNGDSEAAGILSFLGYGASRRR